MISEDQLIEMISEEGNVESIITNLIDKINTIGIAHGGNHDNLTTSFLEVKMNTK